MAFDPDAQEIAGAALASATVARVGLSRGGASLAILGDSRVDMNSDNTAAITQFAANGFVVQALILAGQRLYFDDTLNFGVSGDTIAMAAVRAPFAIASGASALIDMVGTNDLGLASTADDMFSQWRDGIAIPVLKAGINLYTYAEYPRIGLSAFAQGKRNQFNVLKRRFCESYKATGGRLRFIDPTSGMENYVTGTGSALADRLYDGTHPSMIGAYWLAKPLAAAIMQDYPARDWTVSPADLYDATNNPRGCINIEPAMRGSTSNVTAPFTGNVATGFRLFRGTGTSTCTAVGAKENPRTDGPAGGERQRVTINITGAGAATETFICQVNTSPTVGFAAGDWVEAICQVEFASAPVNMIGLESQMAETGPTSPRQALENARQATYKLPSVVWKGVLRTPPFQLQTGVTAISSYCRVVMDASGGAGTADFWISDYQIRVIR